MKDAQTYLNNEQTQSRGAVLITGASSGIGRECAIALDQLGFTVFAGVRKIEHGHSLMQQASKRINPILLDIADDEQISSAVTTMTKQLPEAGFVGIINNAGIALTGPLECVTRSAFQRQLEINVVSQVALIQAFLPLLRRYRGRIVNISSTSGKIAGAFIGPYCASKFAFEAVTTTLARELRSSGITVSIVEPGVVATPFWEKIIADEDELVRHMSPEAHQLYGESLFQRRRKLVQLIGTGMSPEKVSQVVTHALVSKRPKARYVVGFKAKVKMMIARFLPECLWCRR
ncbi:MAG: SDR family NAD(P)-dependent oxidoreductase [Methylococcales bacterium]|nr:SDR family NAD(P)-dependent oxidoreductase [Methylococcales bacterium]MDD5631524.1 SDR family NAD(P)-dependent oxidoreductase [Methylococcales bacterium]